MDTSLVDMETLQQLHMVRPIKSELDLIVYHMSSAGELDKPDMLVIIGSHDVVWYQLATGSSTSYHILNILMNASIVYCFSLHSKNYTLKLMINYLPWMDYWWYVYFNHTLYREGHCNQMFNVCLRIIISAPTNPFFLTVILCSYNLM